MSKKRIRAERTTLLNWGGADREVIVLPATAEAYEQIVEQMAQATLGPSWPMWQRKEKAVTALRAIGITPPKKGRT